MSTATGARIREQIATIAERQPVPLPISSNRFARFVVYCSTGLTGVAVDMATTISFLSITHYLVANIAGFAIAVTWNFGLNWWLTYDKPTGPISTRYAAYVGVHVVTFAIRLAVVSVLVETATTGEPVAALIGILAAAALNFAGMEKIFEDVIPE